MLKVILLIIILAILVVIILASRRPDNFNLSRSAVINAPAATIFENVNELQKWQPWSPWAKMDPAAKTTFVGPAAGVGASMIWDGSMKVGKGKMTIIESKPNELVKFKLDFEKPMAATNYAEFTFKPENGQTTVTWSMTGKANFLNKVVSVVMNCDKMVGDQFEKGLASLKEVSEAKK